MFRAFIRDDSLLRMRYQVIHQSSCSYSPRYSIIVGPLNQSTKDSINESINNSANQALNQLAMRPMTT
eukprot:9679163-Lingulodinium_polyedra.AAC.1